WTWIEFFFGLFAGWWHFIDTKLRSTCFLTVDKWNQILTETGFQHVQIDNEGQPEFAHSLLTARGVDWTIEKPSHLDMTVFDTTDVTTNNLSSYMDKLLQLAQSSISVSDPITVFVLTQTMTPPIGATFTGFTRVWANEATQHRICSIEFDQSSLKEKQL
ncbi:unnamed protein product, partial [Adineta ricciae]